MSWLDRIAARAGVERDWGTGANTVAQASAPPDDSAWKYISAGDVSGLADYTNREYNYHKIPYLGQLVGHTANNITMGLANYAQFLGADSVSNYLYEKGKAGEAQLPEYREPELSLSYVLDPNGFLSAGAMVAGSMLSMAPVAVLAPVGGIAAGAARLAGNVPKVGGLLSYFAPGAVRWATTGPVEAMMEGGGTEREMLENGASREAANAASWDVFKKNAALLTATNALEGGLLGKLGVKTPTFKNPVANGISRAAAYAPQTAAEAVLQGYEEGAQEGIQAAAMGNGANTAAQILHPSNWTEGQWDAARMGVAGGLPLVGGMAIARRLGNRVSRPSSDAPMKSSGNENIDALIAQAAEKYGIPVNLLHSIAQTESEYNQDARSEAGAIGMMQLMPDTAAGLGVDPNDLAGNIEGGAKYMRELLDTFDGDVEKAVAAYNAGPNAVKQHGGIPPFEETQDYVRKVLGGLDGYDTSIPQRMRNLADDAAPYIGVTMDNGTQGCVEAVTKIGAKSCPFLAQELENGVVNVDRLVEHAGDRVIPFDPNSLEEGDVIVYGDGSDPQLHVVLYDGKGGYIGNSTERNKVVQETDYTAMGTSENGEPLVPTKIIKTGAQFSGAGAHSLAAPVMPDFTGLIADETNIAATQEKIQKLIDTDSLTPEQHAAILQAAEMARDTPIGSGTDPALEAEHVNEWQSLIDRKDIKGIFEKDPQRIVQTMTTLGKEQRAQKTRAAIESQQQIEETKQALAALATQANAQPVQNGAVPPTVQQIVPAQNAPTEMPAPPENVMQMLQEEPPISDAFAAGLQSGTADAVQTAQTEQPHTLVSQEELAGILSKVQQWEQPLLSIPEYVAARNRQDWAATAQIARAANVPGVAQFYDTLMEHGSRNATNITPYAPQQSAPPTVVPSAKAHVPVVGVRPNVPTHLPDNIEERRALGRSLGRFMTDNKIHIPKQLGYDLAGGRGKAIRAANDKIGAWEEKRAEQEARAGKSGDVNPSQNAQEDAQETRNAVDDRTLAQRGERAQNGSHSVREKSAQNEAENELPPGYRSESGRPLSEADPQEFIIKPNGSRNFGEIPQEIEDATSGKVKSAPIRLRVGTEDGGFVHLVKEHAAQMKQKGYGVMDYINHILQNFNQVYSQQTEKRPHRFVLYCKGDESKGFMPIDLELEQTGENYYVIVSAMPHKEKIRGTLLFDGSANPSAVTTDDTLLEETNHNGGVGTSPNTHGKSKDPSTSTISSAEVESKENPLSENEREALKGFSADAKNVYRMVRDKLRSFKNKLVGRSSSVGAILLARHAEIIARKMRAITGKPFTAMDYYRLWFALQYGGNADGFTQALNAGVNLDEQVPVVDITAALPQQKMSNKDVLNFLRGLAQKEGTIPSADGKAMFDLETKARHVTYSSRKGLDTDTYKVRQASVRSVRDLLKNAVLVESTPNRKTAKKPNVRAYHRFYVPVRVNGELHTIRVVGEESGNIITLNPAEISLYDVIIENRSSRPLQGISPFVGSTRASDIISIRDMLSGVKDADGNVYAQRADLSDDDRKEMQFRIIEETNPMHDDIHTGIRSVDDILTAKEAFETKVDEDESYLYPDFTETDGKAALKNGEVTIYSSYPIAPGVFVTPSKIQAQDYAGSGKVYSKKVSVKDIAWIHSDEGQYAPIETESFNQSAWHGTPYDFDGFDLGAIGTGEGAQVHGWGLYFAKERKVSEGYREKLTYNNTSGITYNGVPMESLSGSLYYAVIDLGIIENRSEAELNIQREDAIARVQRDLNATKKEAEEYQPALRLIDSNVGATVEAVEKILPNGYDKQRLQSEISSGHGGEPISEYLTDQIHHTNEFFVSRIKHLEGELTELKKLDVSKVKIGKPKPGSLFEVEIPDNDVLLDEQKPFDEQPKFVQEKLVDLCSEKNLFSADDIDTWKFAEKEISETEEVIECLRVALDTQASRSERTNAYADIVKKEYFDFQEISEIDYDDIFDFEKAIENIEKSRDDLEGSLFAYEETLEQQKEEYEKFLDSLPKGKELARIVLRNIDNGRGIYKKVSGKLLGDKAASLALNEVGIKGITYVGGRDGRCYVIFDDQAISIIEKFNQQMNAIIKGTTQDMKDGQRIISLLAGADESTFLHEMGHLFLLDLERLADMSPTSAEELQTVRKWAAWSEGQAAEYKGTPFEAEFAYLDARIRAALKRGDEKKANKLKRQWEHERFARGFERYLQYGEAPTKGLRSVFAKFRAFLQRVYQAFTGTGGRATPEVEAVMARMIAMEEADVAENIENGKKAMQTVVATHQDVKNAMERSDVGAIDFVWGEAGKGAKFKQGKGIAHILAKHVPESGSELLDKIVETIAKGEVIQEKTAGGSTQSRLVLEHNGYVALLSMNDDSGAWLLSGWETYDSMKKRTSSASGEGDGSTVATATAPMRSRRDGEDVLSSVSNISPNEAESKQEPTLENILQLAPSLKKAALEYGAKDERGKVTFADEERKQEFLKAAKALLSAGERKTSARRQEALQEMLDGITIIPPHRVSPRKRVIADWGREMGVTVVFFKGDPSLHGFHQNGVTFLNVDSEITPQWTFWHEAMHWMKANNPDIYNDLVAAISGEEGFTKEQLDAYRREIGAPEMSDADVIEEMLADALPDVKRRVPLLRDIGKRDTGLVQRVVAWIRDVMRRFHDHFHTPQGGLTSTQRVAMTRAFGNLVGSIRDAEGKAIFRIENEGARITLRGGKPLPTVKYSLDNRGKEGDNEGGRNLGEARKEAICSNVLARMKTRVHEMLKQGIPFAEIQKELEDENSTSREEALRVFKTQWNIFNSPRVNKRNIIERITKREDFTDDEINELFEQYKSTMKEMLDYGGFIYKEAAFQQRGNREFLAGVHSWRDLERANARHGGSAHTGHKNSLNTKHLESQGAFSTPKFSANTSNNAPKGNFKLLKDRIRSLVGVAPADNLELPGRVQRTVTLSPKDLEKRIRERWIQEKNIISKEKQKDGKIAVTYYPDTHDVGFADDVKSVRQVAKRNPFVKVLYDLAHKAMKKQEKLRNEFGKALKEFNELVKNEKDLKSITAILWQGDAEGRVFSDAELRSLGANERVIKAYRLVRRELEKAYKMLRDAQTQVKTRSQTLAPESVESFKKNHWIEDADVISAVPRADGRVLLTWRGGRTYDVKGKTMDAEALELMKKDENVNVTSVIPEGDGTFSVSYVERIKPVFRRTGYMPHFFHEWMIYEKYKDPKTGEERYTSVASGRTMNEAVKIGNEIAAKNKDKQYILRPKGFDLGTENAAVIGDMDFAQMSQKLAESTEISLADARSLLLNNAGASLKSRHRFFGSLLERKDGKGFDQDVQWVLAHYFNSAARYIAMEDFKPAAISMYERFFGRFDDEPKNLTAQYCKNYINDVNGNPRRVETALNDLIKKTPIGKYVTDKFGDRVALALNGELSTWNAITKMGLFNFASATVNFSQFINIGAALNDYGYAMKGLKRALHPSAMDEKIIEASGILGDINAADDNGGYTQRRGGRVRGIYSGIKKVGEWTLIPFREADMLMRKAAVLGAYYQGVEQKGMKTAPGDELSAEALAYAQEINDDANFDCSSANAPGIFRAGSVFTQQLSQFQKYPIMQFEFMYNIMKNGTRGQKVRFFVPYVLFCGIPASIPFGGLLNQIFSDLFGFVAGDDDKDFAQEVKAEVLRWAGKDPVKKAIAETALYGILAPTFGLDISGRIGMSNAFGGEFYGAHKPESVGEMAIQQLGGPALNSVYSARHQLAQGNPIEALKAVSPALGNMFQAAFGESRTTRHRVNARYDSTYDKLVHALGFRSVEESKNAFIMHYEYEQKGKAAQIKREAIQDYIADPSDENRRTINALGITDKQIKEARIQQERTALERAREGRPKTSNKSGASRQRKGEAKRETLYDTVDDE
nr:MAG TPA: hypothetical protein [Caudoviricetes sp.]